MDRIWEIAAIPTPGIPDDYVIDRHLESMTYRLLRGGDKLATVTESELYSARQAGDDLPTAIARAILIQRSRVLSLPQQGSAQ